MQQIQDLILMATGKIVKLTHKTAATQDSEDFDQVTYAIALLGQANTQINLRRKELQKSDLDPKIIIMPLLHSPSPNTYMVKIQISTKI